MEIEWQGRINHFTLTHTKRTRAHSNSDTHRKAKQKANQKKKKEKPMKENCVCATNSLLSQPLLSCSFKSNNNSNSVKPPNIWRHGMVRAKRFMSKNIIKLILYVGIISLELVSTTRSQLTFMLISVDRSAYMDF